MAISLFLIVFDFARASVEKVSLLGTELLVGEPRVLEALGWVVWGYFFWRYVQYLLAEPEFGKGRARIGWLLNDYSSVWLSAASPRDSAGNVLTIQSRMAGNWWNRRWIIGRQSYNVGTGRVEVVDETQTRILRYWWWILRALVHLTLLTTYVTDYIVRILLAVAAPIVNWWAPIRVAALALVPH